MEEFKQTQVMLISKNENDCAKYTETIQENGLIPLYLHIHSVVSIQRTSIFHLTINVINGKG